MKSNYLCCRRGVFILLFLCAQLLAYAQTIQVKGKVIDQNGDPLPGVNIIVQGTTNGTITTVSGDYSIDVDGNASLVFNFLGFASQTIAVNNQSVINVTLIEDSEKLSIAKK